MRLQFLAITALFLSQLISSAQEGSKKTCRILFLGAPAGAPQKLFLSDGTSAQPVDLPSMNLSKVYQLPAGDLILRMLPAMPDPKVPLPEDAPKAAVGKALEDIYLLVAHDPANKVAPVRFQVINAKTSGFTNGQLLWFNLSPHRVIGKIGSQKLDLASNSQAIVSAPASAAGDYNVAIGYVPAGTERAEPLCETVWQHDPRSKYIVMVVPVPDSRLPRVMGFPDYREPTKE